MTKRSVRSALGLVVVAGWFVGACQGAKKPPMTPDDPDMMNIDAGMDDTPDTKVSPKSTK